MEKKTIYALGFFDGVHRGHQALLEGCRQLAQQNDCTAGVVTFLGHPDTLVSGTTPPLINTPADRARLLHRYGMQKLVELPFDRALMDMEYRSFLKMLVSKYHAAGFVCGHDFRFGRKGEGNAEKLTAFCEESGLPVTVIPEQKIDDITISSTHIRSLLEQGDVESAARFLGHSHILTGTVVPGRKLGRSLGTPTANLALPQGVLVPAFGVYICRCHIDGKSYPAVTNVGMRPTVEGSYVTVEPWILDFDGDLYGKELTLEFYKFLRPERKFPSLEELRAEILKNGEETRKFFENF
jgi:riboflavin kinase/FMN adenylyltransferase